MIEAIHLTKRYRKHTAVSDISFTVQTGKVTGFLGPNGAGKSTTMRLMLGLDHGLGKTLFDGKPLQEHPRPMHTVGILLEAKAFHPTRRARDHLAVLASAGDTPQKRVDEVLDLVGLKQVARKRPGKFSLGMSQRLGIAAAILGNPKYLILDEPANGLDPEGIAWLRTFLSQYADQGNAVFVSSHLLSEMSLMADNIVVIGKGKLIANTTMKDLTSGASNSGVFVRVKHMPALATALKSHDLPYSKDGEGVLVKGVSTDQVGILAYNAGLPVLQLENRSASLEEAFLELTSASEEYKASLKSGGKK